MVDIFGNDVISIEESRDLMEHHPKDLYALLNSLAVDAKNIQNTLLEYQGVYGQQFDDLFYKSLPIESQVKDLRDKVNNLSSGLKSMNNSLQSSVESIHKSLMDYSALDLLEDEQDEEDISGSSSYYDENGNFLERNSETGINKLTYKKDGSYDVFEPGKCMMHYDSAGNLIDQAC